MPAVTFLRQYEATSFRECPDDPEANKLLQEIRKLDGGRWLLEIRSLRKNRFLRKPGYVKSYSLYVDLGDGSYQAINLASGAGTRVGVMNFMLGFISGRTSASAKADL